MTHPALALLLALAACTPPATSPLPADAQPPATAGPSADSPAIAGASGFDAQAWLARARAHAGTDVSDPSDPRLGEIRALTAELDAATGWDLACDRYWNPETQQMTVDENGPAYLRGIYTVNDIRPGEAIVAVQCDFGANSGTDAFVHIVGRQAALLLGQSVASDGTLFGPPTALYNARSTFTPEGFEILASSSAGSCGTDMRYRIAALDRAELVEARGMACGGAGAPSAEWPVVFPRP